MGWKRRPRPGNGYPSIIKLLALVPLATAPAMAGCASRALVGMPSPLREVAADQALAMPDPGGPAIVSVTEQAYANALEQSVFLSTEGATPGQNVLRVRLFGPMDRSAAGHTSLKPGSLADDGPDAGMRASLAGVPMRRSPLFVQNRYGPFGYALGDARDGERCLYAWQRVAAPAPRSFWTGDKGSVRLDLRFCDARMSEGELVALMDGFTLNGFFRDAAWNPLGRAQGPSVGLGRPGHATQPFEDEAGRPSERRAPAPARRSERASGAAHPFTQRPPAPIGATVPPPPGAGPLATGEVPGSAMPSPERVVPSPLGSASSLLPGAPSGVKVPAPPPLDIDAKS